MSFPTAAWQNWTEHLPIFLKRIYYTTFPSLKRFDTSNTQNWNTEKKTENVSQNVWGEKKKKGKQNPKQKTTQTRADEHNKEMISSRHSSGSPGAEKHLGV